MQYMQKRYIPIAYAPQESTSVQNVSVIILSVLKTIFQDQADLPILIIASEQKNN